MPRSVRFTKRLMDLIIASLSLLLASPILILIAILIKLDSRGPVFFWQPRVKTFGHDDIEIRGVAKRKRDQFWMCKFRTMVEHAADMNGDNSVENDPRVTRIGRWLRPFRIDEIPNLFNVVRGEMSIVGPRADRITAFHEVSDDFPFVYERTRFVKPGITGLAQLHLQSDGSLNGCTTFNDQIPSSDVGKEVKSFRYKLYYDFAYQIKLTEFWSFLKTDLYILFKTPIVMLFKHNTI